MHNSGFYLHISRQKSFELSDVRKRNREVVKRSMIQANVYH